MRKKSIADFIRGDFFFVRLRLRTRCGLQYSILSLSGYCGEKTADYGAEVCVTLRLAHTYSKRHNLKTCVCV